MRAKLAQQAHQVLHESRITLHQVQMIRCHMPRVQWSLQMTHPTAKAGAILWAARLRGKLNGETTHDALKAL